MASNFGRDLLERRVPQYLAVYLGASWAVIEFFAFLEDRFLLSPHLTNLVLLLLVLVLPSVVMFTYFHGRKGADAWTRTEKIFIPANILVVAVILLAAFSGKELGAVTTTVTVRDEAGNAVERVVPRSEFRQRLALFPLDSDTTNGEQAWLGESVADALMVDLMQDMFVDVEQRDVFQEQLEEAGFGTGQGIPGALKRQLSQEIHVGRYVDGTARRSGEAFEFTLALHDADRGHVVTERSYAGPDLFALVDEASVQLRRDLEIPLRHIEENPDVPVSQILTGSVPALRSMTEATMLSVSPTGLPVALEKLDQAVADDPAFALAHLERAAVLIRMGDMERAREAIQQAMEHSYRLPERLQYHVKGEWFGIQLDLEKMFAVYEMWADLYPHDLRALSAVAQLRQLRDDRRGAIEALEQILELDPTQLEVLPQIASLYEAMGEPRRARRFYERYLEASPGDTDPYLSLAGLQRRLGEHDRARELYDRALLIAPGDVDILVSLASLDRDTGRFDEALAGYQAALDVARTPRQRYTALQELATFHLYRGSAGAAIDYIEQAAAEGRSFQAPISQVQLRLLSLDTYVLAGRADRALELLDSLAARLEPPLDAIVPVGRIQVFSALEQPEPLADAVEAGRAMLTRLQYNVLRQPVLWGEGRLHEIRGEWAEAAAAFQQAREANPMDPKVPAQIGRCYRELGDLNRAESLIRETLRALPSHARSHYELARVHEAMGRRDDAVMELERALDTWAPADTSYQAAADARALLARLDPGR